MSTKQEILAGMIREGRTALGIEFGSTRIKAVLIGEDNEPIASGSYDWENRRQSIKTHREYWIPKIERNIAKDEEVNHILTAMGWRVIRLWEHEIRKDLEGSVEMIMRAIEEARASGRG